MMFMMLTMMMVVVAMMLMMRIIMKMMIFTHLKDLLNRSAFSLKKALMVVIFAN